MATENEQPEVCEWCAGKPGVDAESVHLGLGIWTHAIKGGGRHPCSRSHEKSRELWRSAAERMRNQR